MTLESIGKLREALKDCTSVSGIEPNKFDTYWITAAACDKYIDEIEREIAERYMELPVDADGVPIRVGDEVFIDPVSKTVYEVEAVGDGFVVFDGMFERSSNDCRHVTPRTIEDVLRDCCNEWNEHCGGDWEQGVYAKYADELRGMGVGE